MNLFLVGYRGTGKSTLGKLLADRLGLSFVDADARLEQQAGRSIVEIFAQQGEHTFRELEARVLTELTAGTDQVVATGGGVVLREENRAALRRSGPVIWLQASPETIDARLQSDPSTSSRRPALTTEGPLAEIRKLLAARQSYYEQVADFAVSTDQTTLDAVVDEIVCFLNQQPRKPT